MTADSSSAPVRRALIEQAAHILATEGAAALTLRRLAADVGTSTMAIYTHFGGMRELRRAIRRDGFGGLAQRLQQVADTSDPVADLAALGLAYYANGCEHGELYRVMFLEQPLDDLDAAIGWDTFAVLVRGVERCVAARRFRRSDATEVATQLWALSHGVVALQLAKLVPAEASLSAFGDAALALFVGYGDDRARARASLRRAVGRIALT